MLKDRLSETADAGFGVTRRGHPQLRDRDQPPQASKLLYCILRSESRIWYLSRHHTDMTKLAPFPSVPSATCTFCCYLPPKILDMRLPGSLQSLQSIESL